MSLFHRLVARPRPVWLTAGISVILVLVPLLAITLDRAWEEFLRLGWWRPMLQAPAVIIFILIISPIMEKSEAEVLKGFRPLARIDDERFDQVVREASRIHPLAEVIATLLGALFGIRLSLSWLSYVKTFWLRLYIPTAQLVMFGLLGLIIYDAFASTRLISALHRQPLNIDILDTRPFEPMGRHSLITSLVFIGGVTLGMIIGLDVKSLMNWQAWITILPFMAVPVIIFYLSMIHTHRVLRAEKARELQAVSQRIQEVCAEMRGRIARGENLEEIGVEYTALISLEGRLRSAFTWPYNTAMVRTLSFTIVIPLLVRAISALLFGQ